MISFKLRKPGALQILATALFLLSSFNLVRAQDSNPYLGIIPAPASLVKSPGTFTFSNATVIRADQPKDKAVGLLKDWLNSNQHFNNKVIKYSKSKSRVTGLILTSAGSADLPKEGYKLIITP